MSKTIILTIAVLTLAVFVRMLRKGGWSSSASGGGFTQKGTSHSGSKGGF